MFDNDRERDLLDSKPETSAPGLPRPDLNPLVNPLLGENMGRWAQVYFTTPAVEREQAVEELLHELQAEAAGKKPAPTDAPPIAQSAPASSEGTNGTPPTAAPVEKNASRDAHELPVPQFTKPKPVPPEAERDRDLVVCPGCLHKNAAEQRFCGICGFPLSQESAAPATAQPTPVPELSTPAPQRAENPETDWQWLRQRSLADLEPVEETRSGGARTFVGIVVLLLVIAGAYVLWQNRSRLLPETAPPASAAAAPPVSSSATNVPPPVVAPNAQTQPAPGSNSAPRTETRVPQQQGQSTNNQLSSAAAPTAPNSTPSAGNATLATAPHSLVGDGSQELEEGRRYLSGDGVPQNSWMATQWLWKSVGKQNSDAVLLLSDLYARGEGVPRSCEQARVLLVSAAKKGSPVAAQKLRSLETSCR